eukprot:CAMPEP_0119378074 /NCGR_PEP_ID=MMETSP1334-20130426/47388_1 /TAXON_ID=127549 /ORGANISM="Calcidiscus leptoporus, Strain RCC1130" /LENGTH=60 /DNA_ID=CAMNT_0007397179 /DNA_START=430 /DNA_END=612 /DNA_ORIENTATION=+
MAKTCQHENIADNVVRARGIWSENGQQTLCGRALPARIDRKMCIERQRSWHHWQISVMVI